MGAGSAVTEPRPRRRPVGSSWTRAGSCRATCSWRSRGPGTTGRATRPTPSRAAPWPSSRRAPSRGSLAARPSGSTTRRPSSRGSSPRPSQGSRQPRPSSRGSPGRTARPRSPTSWRISSRPAVAARGCWGPRATSSRTGRGRPRTPRPTPRPWLSSWPRTALPGGTRSPWRSAPTPWSRSATRASRSTRRSSRTSAATTSTTTGPSTRTARRRPACSRRSHPAGRRSSTPMIQPRTAWRAPRAPAGPGSSDTARGRAPI